MPITDYVNEIILALLGILLLISIIQFICYRGMVRQQQRLLSFMRMHGGEGIEKGLENCTTRLKGIEAGLDDVSQWQRATEAKLERCVRAPLVLRYNAFDDTGSELSFSTAFLDARGEGAVLTTLYSRSESRTYCKPVSGGASTFPLTDEEQDAIEQSMGSR